MEQELADALLAKEGLNSQIDRLNKLIKGMEDEQVRLGEKVQQSRVEHETEQNELRVI